MRINLKISERYRKRVYSMLKLNKTILAVAVLIITVGSQEIFASGFPWETNKASNINGDGLKTFNDIGTKILLPLKSLSCLGKELKSIDEVSTGFKIVATLGETLSCENLKNSSVHGNLVFTILGVGEVSSKLAGHRDCNEPARGEYPICTFVFIDTQSLQVSLALDHGKAAETVITNNISVSSERQEVPPMRL